MATARVLIGDVRKVMATLPDGSIDLVMTSPPFLALRSYLPDDHPDKPYEIGSEATPADFLDTLLELTDEWGRLLAPHGSIAVELGDTYAGSGGAGGDYAQNGLRDGQPTFRQAAARTTWRLNDDGSVKTATPQRLAEAKNQAMILPPNYGTGWPLDKSLCLLPSLYAGSLAYGRNLLNPSHTIDPWRVRNLVAWVRSNPPVGALGDKVRPATSYITMACKSRTRWFDLDAVRVPLADSPEVTKDYSPSKSAGGPPLDWWLVNSDGGFPGAHYATFPAKLVVRPVEMMCPRRVCRTCGEPSRRITGPAEYIQSPDAHASGRAASDTSARTWSSGIAAGKNQSYGLNDGGVVRAAATTGWTTCGCPGADGIRLDGFHTGPGWRPGVVLDPFVGSGTVLQVATGHGRDAIGIDLDSRAEQWAAERCGMFLEPTEAVS